MKNMFNQCNKFDFIITFFILSLASIQNRFFDDMFTFAGMDALSFLLTLILFFSFFRMLFKKKFIFDIDELILILYFFLVIILSILKYGFTSNVLVNLRTTIYFLFSFFIFKNIKINDFYIIKLFILSGFLNSLIYLFFYFQNIGTFGVGFRDVSINLYFSLFAVFLCLFCNIANEKKVLKLCIIFLCSITIIISQQRTQIIPLILIFIIYIFSNIKLNLSNLFKLLIICLTIVITINVVKNIGIFDFLKKRFEINSIISSEDTLGFRIKTTYDYFSNYNFIKWIFGTGINGDDELEMLIPNYIYKYGLFGLFLIFYITLFTFIQNGIKFNNSYKRLFLISLFIMSIGGLISGFGGANGQLFVSAIMGLTCGNNISTSQKCTYSIQSIKPNNLL